MQAVATGTVDQILATTYEEAIARRLALAARTWSPSSMLTTAPLDPKRVRVGGCVPGFRPTTG